MVARDALIPRQILNGVGWAVVAAAAALVLAVAGPLAFGDHPHTVLTGSMEPTIAAGDVVIDEQIAPTAAAGRRHRHLPRPRRPEPPDHPPGAQRSAAPASHLCVRHPRRRQQHHRALAHRRRRSARPGRLHGAVGRGTSRCFTRTPLGLVLLVVVPTAVAGAGGADADLAPAESEAVGRRRASPRRLRSGGERDRGARARRDRRATLAAFAPTPKTRRHTVTAAPDFVAPAITATAVAKTRWAASPGFVSRGGTYFVYANVSADTGNPASGLATVKADAAELTTGPPRWR